jgi:hypothetical protein
MTYLGTRGREDAVDAVALERGPVPVGGTRDGWLMFSQGGAQPWRETRSAAEVRAKLGTFTSLTVAGGALIVVRARDDDPTVDEPERISCERARTLLALPGCARALEKGDTRFTFIGAGAGHGAGLDVERAKERAKAGATAAELLREAYGTP